MIKSVATVEISPLLDAYSAKVSSSQEWYLSTIGGIMSLIAVVAIISFILRKSS